MHAIAQLLWPRPSATLRKSPRKAPIAEPRSINDDRGVVPVAPTTDRLPMQDPCLPWWFDQSLA